MYIRTGENSAGRVRVWGVDLVLVLIMIIMVLMIIYDIYIVTCMIA